MNPSDLNSEINPDAYSIFIGDQRVPLQYVLTDPLFIVNSSASNISIHPLSEKNSIKQWIDGYLEKKD